MRMFRKQIRSAYLIGSVRVKDCLFLGDEYSSKVNNLFNLFSIEIKI